MTNNFAYKKDFVLFSNFSPNLNENNFEIYVLDFYSFIYTFICNIYASCLLLFTYELISQKRDVIALKSCVHFNM